MREIAFAAPYHDKKVTYSPVCAKDQKQRIFVA